jgi:hypothetical protein
LARSGFTLSGPLLRQDYRVTYGVIDGISNVRKAISMCQETYNFWSIILSAATVVAAIYVASIYLKQLRTMERSLKDQNLAWLIQYLQSSEVRDARYVVRMELRDKKEEWNKGDKKNASTACAAYGVAGFLARRKKVDIGIIIDNWGRSVIDICTICNGLIVEMRTTEPKTWEDLLWLKGEAHRYLKVPQENTTIQ